MHGTNEVNAINSAIAHMYEYHAIKPEEMTTCMKIRIRNGIHAVSKS
jgi:hypothetical protein